MLLLRKLLGLARLAGSALIVFHLSGCAHNQIRSIYSGPERDDRDVSALYIGHRNAGADTWIAVVSGVDETMCQFEGITSNDLPRPMFHCGNLVKILPGVHRIKYIVQTNDVSASGPYLRNAWRRTSVRESGEFSAEKGTLYRVSPRLVEGQWEVSIDPVCTTSRSFGWRFEGNLTVVGYCIDK